MNRKQDRLLRSWSRASPRVPMTQLKVYEDAKYRGLELTVRWLEAIDRIEGVRTKKVQDERNYRQIWKDLLQGQDAKIDAIAHAVDVFNFGMAAPGRPAGVFLMTGPTGTGKTHTVETLAEALHGSPRNLLRINCTEFQMDHEVAKLIGAPPGYLGHRETQPMLNQQKLNSVTSDNSGLSLVLFDEIEKAAGSLQRLLLNVLDKATLNLGDNTQVNFERTIIFMTSNIGTTSAALSAPGFIAQPRGVARGVRTALAKHFAPEFMNRIDQVLTYDPLDNDALLAIMDRQITLFNRQHMERRGPLSFYVALTPAAKQVIIDQCEPERFGARELKRLLHLHLMKAIMPLQTASPMDTIHLDWADGGLIVSRKESRPARARRA